MLRPRIIPLLLLSRGGLVKTRTFANARYVGDPINTVRIFNEKAADELVTLDIDATVNGTEPNFKMISGIAVECRMPLCYGGGIKTVDQATKIVRLGVEKIAISSAALADPMLIKRIAEQIGSQSMVVALDVRRRSNGYRIFTHNGRKDTGRRPDEFAAEAESLGAGEILLNSIDNDGSMKGYDIALATHVRSAISIPLSVCGGAGSLDDVRDLISECGTVGAAAGSMFVFKGSFRAVLVNYPTAHQREALFNSTLRFQ